MAKHKKRNMRKAKIKRHNNKSLKCESRKSRYERLDMSYRISKVCPENSKNLNNDIAEYGSNLEGKSKKAFRELISQMESGEIYV